MDILLKRWFSKLPRGMNSYTSSRCSSSQQYPINFTRWGCRSRPRTSTSACRWATGSKQHKFVQEHMRERGRSHANSSAHQPFLVALPAIQVQELHRNRLWLQPGLHLIVNEASVDGPEATFSEEVADGEALRRLLQLSQGEDIEIRSHQRYGQVLRG